MSMVAKCPRCGKPWGGFPNPCRSTECLSQEPILTSPIPIGLSAKPEIVMQKQFGSIKRYRHNIGLSCAFRQWKAHSHCRFTHGYSLGIDFEFRATDLSIENWVVDFGAMKSLKGILETTFDHKTLVAEDDPELEWFREAHKRKIIDMIEVPKTGCEAFADMVWEVGDTWLTDNGFKPRVYLHRVDVWEHEANAAFVVATPYKSR